MVGQVLSTQTPNATFEVPPVQGGGTSKNLPPSSSSSLSLGRAGRAGMAPRTSSGGGGGGSKDGQRGWRLDVLEYLHCSVLV